MNGRRQSSRARRIVRMILVAALALVLLAIVLVKLTPGVYRRTEGLGPDEAQAARFNEEVLNQIGNVSLDRSGATRLRLEVTEAMVNAKLQRAVVQQAEEGKSVPPVLRDLRIAFEPGRLVLATRIGQGLSAVIVSQQLGFEVQEDGGLRVMPGWAGAGMIPLPASLMDAARRMLLERLTEHEDATKDSAADEKGFDLGRGVLEALEGKPVFLGKGKKRIQLDRVEVERGVLRVEGHRADLRQPAPPAP